MRCFLEVFSDKCMNSAITTLHDKSSLITDWCNANKLRLNDDKIQDLTVGLSTNRHTHSLKFLGVLVQSNLKWQHHIGKVAACAARGVFMIRALKHNVTPDVLLSVYYA